MNFLKRNHTEIDLACQARLSGEYKLIVRGSDGEVRRETPWFDNMILDSGLNAMGTIATVVGCSIGTGTSATLASQTALASPAAYTTTVSANSSSVAGASPYRGINTTTFRFAIGALNGNYSEVGVGWNSTSMFSRALVVDGVGAPTTITVGSAEQLDVVYRLNTYFPLTDTSAVVTISGVNYNMLGRTAAATTSNGNLSRTGSIAVAIGQSSNASESLTIYAGPLGIITGQPSGVSSLGNVGPNNAAYSNNSLVRQGSYLIGLTTNLTGNAPMKSFRSVVDGLGTMQFQYQFEKVSDGTGIPKDNTKTLSMTFQVGWGRRP